MKASDVAGWQQKVVREIKKQEENILMGQPSYYLATFKLHYEIKQIC